jgi:hypothetical protein
MTRRPCRAAGTSGGHRAPAAATRRGPGRRLASVDRRGDASEIPAAPEPPRLKTLRGSCGAIPRPKPFSLCGTSFSLHGQILRPFCQDCWLAGGVSGTLNAPAVVSACCTGLNHLKGTRDSLQGANAVACHPRWRRSLAACGNGEGRGSPQRRRWLRIPKNPTPATAQVSAVWRVECPAIRVAASYRLAALAGPCVAIRNALELQGTTIDKP